VLGLKYHYDFVITEIAIPLATSRGTFMEGIRQLKWETWERTLERNLTYVPYLHAAAS
jgi:hypothetical protein